MLRNSRAQRAQRARNNKIYLDLLLFFTFSGIDAATHLMENRDGFRRAIEAITFTISMKAIAYQQATPFCTVTDSSDRPRWSGQSVWPHPDHEPIFLFTKII